MQYLLYFSEDGMAITEMATETVIYDNPVSYANDIINISVVSPSYFRNILIDNYKIILQNDSFTIHR